MKRIVFLFPLMIMVIHTNAQLKDIRLPQPQRSGGKGLMDCLNERKSDRTFADKALDLQTLSDLLWAAYGINRESESKRTVPSALNMQEMTLYVFIKEGVYLYDAKENNLKALLEGDHRKATGSQDFVKNASVNIVYVANFNKMGKAGDKKSEYAYADAAFICQNVYLFCASRGLATVVRGSVNGNEIKRLLSLPEDLKVIFGQSVGYKE